MSLIDWVRWDRNLIDALFDKPAFNIKGELKAEPLTKNYSTVGTAFDYAFRLKVAHSNAKLVSDFPLVAEHGIRGNRKRKEFINNFRLKRIDLIKGQLTIYDLLPDCVILAKMEAVYRSGRDFPNSDIFHVDEADVQDLGNLIEVVDLHLFTAKKKCILNPTFGQSSLDVGGADADFIIDGVLIDVKTTKFLKFEREHFRQLMGYYILNIREGEIHGEIESLGIYYSRFGVLFTFPAPEEYNRIKRNGKVLDLFDAVEDSIREYQKVLGITPEF